MIFGLLPATPALANSQAFYNVFVDTSTISGMTGSLDFQFDASSPLSQFAFAEILNFKGGSLIPPPSITGDVSGVLPGIVVLNNDTPSNGYLEGFTFGPNILFDLLLAGPAVSNPGPLPFSSLFSFGVVNSAGMPLLTSSGSLFTVSVNPGGTTTVNIFSPVVTVTPEPASLLLLLTAVAVVSMFGRRAKFLLSKS